MKKYFDVCLVGIIMIALVAGCKPKTNSGSVSLKTKMDTVSYIIGNNIGNNFKQNALDVNTDALVKGIEETMKGDKPMFSDSMVKVIMTGFQKEMMAKQDEKRKTDALKANEEGNKFLAENKKKDGVIALPDGLQYKVIKMGNGPKPKETDRVKVNYEGKLIDGKVFDSSYERKEPATFPVNQVIKGWTEALQLMPVGSIWEVYVPSELGYGDRGTQNIPGGSTLIFKVELLSIEKPETAQGQPGKPKMQIHN